MRTRIILPAALAVGLLYLAAASSANAFELFERVMGGSAQKGSVQKGSVQKGSAQKGCAQKDHGCGGKLACGKDTSCGCGMRSRGHRPLFAGLHGGCGCGATQKGGALQKGAHQKGGEACQKGAHQKGGDACQKGAHQKGAHQKGDACQKGGALQKGGIFQKHMGCGCEPRVRHHFLRGMGCGCETACGMAKGK